MGSLLLFMAPSDDGEKRLNISGIIEALQSAAIEREKVPDKVRHLFSKFKDFQKAVYDLGVTICSKCKRLINNVSCACADGPFMDVKHTNEAWWNYWGYEYVPEVNNKPFTISIVDYFVNNFQKRSLLMMEISLLRDNTDLLIRLNIHI